MAMDGLWEFNSSIKVFGTAEDPAAARKTADTFAEEASKGDVTVSIEDSEPTLRGGRMNSGIATSASDHDKPSERLPGKPS